MLITHVIADDCCMVALFCVVFIYYVLLLFTLTVIMPLGSYHCYDCFTTIIAVCAGRCHCHAWRFEHPAVSQLLEVDECTQIDMFIKGGMSTT